MISYRCGCTTEVNKYKYDYVKLSLKNLMCNQVLYIATAYCMFRPVMFSIFSICTLYFVGKSYYTFRPAVYLSLHMYREMCTEVGIRDEFM